MILYYCCQYCKKVKYVNALDCYNHEAICNENPKLKKCFSCKHYSVDNLINACSNRTARQVYKIEKSEDWYYFLAANTPCSYWGKKQCTIPFNYNLKDPTDNIDAYVCEIDVLAGKKSVLDDCGSKKKCVVKDYLKHIGMSIKLCCVVGIEMISYITNSLLNKFKEK